MFNKNKINITYLTNKIVSGNWLLTPSTYNVLINRVENYKAPSSFDRATNGILSLLAPKEDDSFLMESNVTDNEQGMAVISIDGIIVKGASERDEEEFGLCNIDKITEMFMEAEADPSISEIVLFVNSPGGEVTGVPEFCRMINKSSKLIIGWTENVATSAAYYILSQCKMVGMAPSAQVGSVGVYCLVEDLTKAMEKSGVSVDAIFAGKHKLIGHSFRSLTEEERNILQEDVNTTYNNFKSAVTTMRPIADEDLQGLTYKGDTALTKGFVDVVSDSFGEFLTTVTTNISNDTMKKFIKISKPVVTSVTPAVVAEVVPIVQSASTEEKPKEEEKVEIEEKHEVSCPHCNKSFEVKYDDEAEAEVKPDEPHSEPDKDDEVVPSKIEDKKEKASTPNVSVEEWDRVRGINRAQKPEVAAWQSAIASTFKI